jgi:hypothetical protein
VLAFPACSSFPSQTVEARALGPEERELLTRLRWWLVDSKLIARASIEEACFVLRSEAEVHADAYGVALFRLLNDHARRRLAFYGPEVEACSDDERWLLRLLALAQVEDEPGIRAMIAWRIAPTAHRRARFLLEGLGRLLDQGQGS